MVYVQIFFKIKFLYLGKLKQIYHEKDFRSGFGFEQYRVGIGK